ncbi:MAG: DUF4249 family protein [Bacteroidota bacterium]
MTIRFLFSIVLIILCAACVDRITFDVGSSPSFAIVIDGSISDQPGPYKILVTKAFDIESKLSIKTPISVKRILMSDNLGNNEVLSEVTQGEYQTSPNGIRGTIGRAYKIQIELLDGRIYESVPDTLYPSGSVDSLYHTFKEEKTTEGATNYGFDVFFNSSAGDQNSYYFLWQFVGTFQVETHPELYTEPCGEGRCPKPLPCSSYVLGSNGFEYVKVCECCACWSNLFNDEVIVSDNQLVNNGRFTAVKASYVPINRWTFGFKVYAQVNQMSLSRQSFSFWKAVKSQKSATTSLFQPVTGKIPSNFIQTNGPSGPIEGIFFATSIYNKGIFITQRDIPNPSIIPISDLTFNDNCINLFPNSTTEKPPFWTD